MDYTIDEDRLSRVTALHHGSHGENDDGKMCAMEAVAYIAREPWSDHPTCACPVISAFMRAWNDGLPSKERGMLLPLIPKLVGTRSTPEIEKRRSLMAADWLIRTHTPAWLRLAGLTAQADAIASLPEITSMAQYPSIRGPLEAVRKDAAAAGAAAGAAARAAAWAAAWAAAGAAARAAAWDAAGAAARAAARAAAGAAAGAALAGTKAELQKSAFALVERMISITE